MVLPYDARFWAGLLLAALRIPGFVVAAVPDFAFGASSATADPSESCLARFCATFARSSAFAAVARASFAFSSASAAVLRSLDEACARAWAVRACASAVLA